MRVRVALPIAAVLAVALPGMAVAKVVTETVSLPVKVANGKGETIEHTIRVTVMRDDARATSPFMIINHGRGVNAEINSKRSVSSFGDNARYFVGKGYAVFLPLRIGYGATGGEDVESSGRCDDRRYEPAYEAGAAQTLAVIDYAKTLPFIRREEGIVAGQSMGGTIAIAVAAKNVVGIKAALNFAGGGGGNPSARAEQPCSPERLMALFARYGETARIPTLWLYSENDKYWGPQLPHDWAKAFSERGGRAEFVQLPPYKDDGHASFTGNPEGWKPAVEKFLSACCASDIAPAPDKSTVQSREAALAQICPAATWERTSPKSAGWSSAALKKADAIAKDLDTDSYLVVAGGKVIWEYGDTHLASNVHSIRKSIASLLYGIASDRGQVPIERTLAELGVDDEGGLSATEKTATIRDLLSARSCIYHQAAYETKEQLGIRPERYSCRPGERWFYNNWDFNALGSIFRSLTNTTLFDAFDSELAGPLQLEHFKKAEHTQFHKEDVSRHPAYLFRLSALDLARIGLLAARGGDWCGKRIVSKSWIDASTAKISDSNRGTGYGYLWWVGENGKQFGTQFKDKAFSARGSRGQFMIVNPADDLVIVHRVDTDAKGAKVKTREFEELLAAIVAARR